jgi:ribosome assembly protein 1
MCSVEAHIPVAESFGFVNEVRNKSSGLANPMLEFSHWQMLEEDPFYIPTTKEVSTKIFII